jgi:hypothetical protein
MKKHPTRTNVWKSAKRTWLDFDPSTRPAICPGHVGIRLKLRWRELFIIARLFQSNPRLNLTGVQILRIPVWVLHVVQLFIASAA